MLEKLTLTQIFPVDEAAKEYYDALDKDEKETATINGKTVVTDMTKDFAGTDYDTMVLFMEGFIKQNNDRSAW